METKDFRFRVITPLIRHLSKDDVVQLDLQSFCESLILFDKTIIHSTRLLEIPELVKHFGYGQVLSLLESGIIEIHCDPLSIGEIGQTTGWFIKNRDKPLPLNSFSFIPIQSGDYKKYIHDSLQQFHRITNLHIKKIRKLKLATALKVKKHPDEAWIEIFEQFKTDLIFTNPVIRTAISIQLKKYHGTSITPDKIKITLHHIEKNDFHAESDLNQLISADEKKTHGILTGALSVGYLNRRIGDMKLHSALTGFRNDEIPILDSKLNFLENLISPDTQRERFHRVLSVKKFPDLETSVLNKNIDIEKLLKIRESSECKEFRHWLWSIDDFTEKELNEMLNGIKGKFSGIIHSDIGKAIRWMTNLGIGFIPGISQIVGIPLSIIDTFLIEKVLPKSGALTFINNLYPTIFKDE